MEVKTKIERAEEQRDLKSKIVGLDQDQEREIIFKETSPKRRKTTIYRMSNGQPAQVPEYIAVKVLDKIDRETGDYMFTANPDNAPEYRLGTVLCFLHKDSPDQPILEELGLSAISCRKETLMNPHSKRMHALHRHPQEWEAYQEFKVDKKETDASTRLDKQLEATLDLGRIAAGAPPVAAEPAKASVASKTVATTQTIVDDRTRCNACSEVIEGKLADHHC